MFRFVIVVMVLLIGCEEALPFEMWLDKDCDPIQGVIQQKIDQLNNWVEENTGDVLVDVVGKDSVDHEWMLSNDGSDPNIGRDFIVCFQNEPSNYRESDYSDASGWATSHGNVYLFLWTISNMELESLILHELGHSIGLAHIDEVGVMNPNLNISSFTDEDRKELCKHFGCK